MARFLFVWTIMVGAMIGVRESTPFRGRSLAAPVGARRGGDQADRAARRAGRRDRVPVGRDPVHRLRLVSHLRAGRAAAVDDPHRLADRRRDLADLPRRADVRRASGCSWARPHDRRGAVVGAGGGDPVRSVLPVPVPARPDRLRAGAGLAADPRDRAAPVDRDPGAGDVQRVQLLHPARGAVLPADRQSDERRRHHRPAAAPVARHGRAFPGRARADQRRAVDLLRRGVRLLDRRCGEPVEDLHRGADPGRLRPVLLGRDHRGLGGAGRDHPALDPDDRLGRHPERVDRRPVPGRASCRGC